jgi:hypothetical protein
LTTNSWRQISGQSRNDPQRQHPEFLASNGGSKVDLSTKRNKNKKYGGLSSGIAVHFHSLRSTLLGASQLNLGK